MKPKIQQNVIPRRRTDSITHRSWHVPSVRGNRGIRAFQRGSVDNTTLTISFGLMAIVVVGMLGFLYLQQVVHTASQGTDVQSLEGQIVDLKEKQRQLELEGAELRSLQTVNQRVEKLNLVPAEKVSYLANSPHQVAIAK